MQKALLPSTGCSTQGGGTIYCFPAIITSSQGGCAMSYFPGLITYTQWNYYNGHLTFYRPQTKLRKGYVFTSVCHSVHWGGCLPQCMLEYTHPQADTPTGQTPPFGRHPPGQTRPTRYLLQRTVRILLECILVLPNVRDL